MLSSASSSSSGHLIQPAPRHPLCELPIKAFAMTPRSRSGVKTPRSSHAKVTLPASLKRTLVQPPSASLREDGEEADHTHKDAFPKDNAWLTSPSRRRVLLADGVRLASPSWSLGRRLFDEVETGTEATHALHLKSPFPTKSIALERDGTTAAQRDPTSNPLLLSPSTAAPRPSAALVFEPPLTAGVSLGSEDDENDQDPDATLVVPDTPKTPRPKHVLTSPDRQGRTSATASAMGSPRKGSRHEQLASLEEARLLAPSPEIKQKEGAGGDASAVRRARPTPFVVPSQSGSPRVTLPISYSSSSNVMEPVPTRSSVHHSESTNPPRLPNVDMINGVSATLVRGSKHYPGFSIWVDNSSLVSGDSQPAEEGDEGEDDVSDYDKENAPEQAEHDKENAPLPNATLKRKKPSYRRADSSASSVSGRSVLDNVAEDVVRETLEDDGDKTSTVFLSLRSPRKKPRLSQEKEGDEPVNPFVDPSTVVALGDDVAGPSLQEDPEPANPFVEAKRSSPKHPIAGLVSVPELGRPMKARLSTEEAKRVMEMEVDEA